MGYEKSAHLYDLFDTKENIEFFFHYAKEAGEILDIGAGTGRIAIPLAERGVNVVCIEPSPAMRREFDKKISEKPELSKNIELIAGDAISFDLNRTFSAAYLSGTFDHFLNDEERMASLKNIGKHLKPNGKLIFDVFLGLMKDSPLSPAGKVKKGDIEYRRFVGDRILPNEKMEVLLVFETYIKGKFVKRIEEKSVAGIISRERIHQLLDKCNFEAKNEFGNYDFSKFKENETLLIIEAVKK